MRNYKILVAVSALLMGGGVHAGTWAPPAKNVPPALPVGNCLSYDYVGIQYGIHEFGTPYLKDGDFYGMHFSKSIGSTFYLTGAIYDGSYDFKDICGCSFMETDQKRFRLGLGTRWSIAECVDLTLEGGVEHTDVEFDRRSFYDYDTWSYYVGPGIRARAGRFEFFAKALYTSREGDYGQTLLANHTASALSASEDGWIFSPGVVFYVTENLGLEFAAEIGELDDALLMGVRYTF